MLLNDGHDVTVLDNFMYQQTSLLDCCWQPAADRGARRRARRRLLEEPGAEGRRHSAAGLPDRRARSAPAIRSRPAVNSERDQDHRRARLSREQRSSFPPRTAATASAQAGIYCDEDTPLRPVSLYGRLKVEIEALPARPRQLRHVPIRDSLRRQPADAARSAGQRFHLPGRQSIGSWCCSSRTSSGTTCTCATAPRAFVHALANYDR